MAQSSARNNVSAGSQPILVPQKNRTAIVNHLKSLAGLPWDAKTSRALLLTKAYFQGVTTHSHTGMKRVLKPSLRTGKNGNVAEFQGVTTHGPAKPKRRKLPVRRRPAAAE